MFDHGLEAIAGGRIAVTFDDETTGETIEVWDVAQKKRRSGVHDLRQPAFLDPKGKWLVSCKNRSSDFAAYDPETGREISVLKAPPESERQVAHLLDDGRIAVVWQFMEPGLGCALAVWDPMDRCATIRWSDGKLSPLFAVHSETYGGRRLFIQSKPQVDVWDLTTNPPNVTVHKSAAVRPVRRGYVLIDRQDQTAYSEGRGRFRYVDGASDMIVHSEVPDVPVRELVGDWFIGFVESRPSKILDILPTWFGRLRPWLDAPAKWVIGELRTGSIIQSIPINLSGLGMSSRGFIAPPWYWEINEAFDKCIVRQWPLIAPGPSWWVWLATAIGAVLLANDLRRSWRRCNSVVVSSKT